MWISLERGPPNSLLPRDPNLHIGGPTTTAALGRRRGGHKKATFSSGIVFLHSAALAVRVPAQAIKMPMTVIWRSKAAPSGMHRRRWQCGFSTTHALGLGGHGE